MLEILPEWRQAFDVVGQHQQRMAQGQEWAAADAAADAARQAAWTPAPDAAAQVDGRAR